VTYLGFRDAGTPGDIHVLEPGAAEHAVELPGGPRSDLLIGFCSSIVCHARKNAMGQTSGQADSYKEARMGSSYEGVGPRIRERLLALDYKRDDGEPDVQRFCWDKRFDKGHLYSWLRDEMTPFKDLRRLCDALDCSADWLLFGMDRDSKKAVPGKPRQHGKLKSLWLVLPLAAGVLWPSAAAKGQTLPIGNGGNEGARATSSATLPPPSYRKWRYAFA
jgi:hypothetical protein